MPAVSPIRFRALITFFFAREGAPPPGVSGSIPAMRRLRRGGAQGAQARERSLLAPGVGRIIVVFFVIFARKRLRWLEC